MGNLCAPAAEDKSANKSGKPEDRSIDYKFEKTGVVEFDNFFSEASQVLQDAESLRSGIEDTKAQGMDQSHASYLVTPHFSDMIQVLLWAASADAGGKIQDTDIQHIPDAPFLNINKNKVSKETYALFQLFEQYVATIMDAPKTLEDMVFKLEDMGEKVIQLMEDAKMDIQNSNLSFTGKLKATAEILKNGAKLPKDLIKCKELRQTIVQAKNDMEELLPKLPGLVLDADVVGAQAAAAKLLKPADIFDKFHPGPKKATPPPPATPSSTPSNTAPNTNSNSSPTKPNTNSPASPAKPNTNSTASPTKPAASTTQPAASPTKSTNPADAVVAEAIVVSTHATHHAHHHHHHPHNLE